MKKYVKNKPSKWSYCIGCLEDNPDRQARTLMLGAGNFLRRYMLLLHLLMFHSPPLLPLLEGRELRWQGNLSKVTYSCYHLFISKEYVG
jgi:hypothetical protein